MSRRLFLVACFTLAFALLLNVLPSRGGQAASVSPAPVPGGLTLDYHVKALKDDHPEITLGVKGAAGPSATFSLARGTLSQGLNVSQAFTVLAVTGADGTPLPWTWAERGFTVENGRTGDFQVRYTLDALKFSSGPTDKTIVFRERYLYFVAMEILFMPEAEPRPSPDGEPLSFDVPPLIEDNRVLVPLRAIAEAMGATVQWDDVQQVITVARGNRLVGVSVGGLRAIVDGEPVYLDVPPRILHDRTLVPVRFIAQAFGAIVGWDEQTRTVTITSGSGR